MNNIIASNGNLNTNENEIFGYPKRYNEILKYAKWYVEEGLTIIPLDGKTLQPLLSSWEQYAHTETRATIEDVEQWLRQWPDLRFGLATGRGIGLIVIHLKNGSHISPWPKTICAETSEGGIDLFFFHPGNYRPSSVKVKSVKDFLPGMDSIGDDDYIVLPLSISDDDGPSEGWINSFDDIEMCAKVPDDILPLILQDPDYVMSNVPEGVPTPEEERYELVTQYLTKLLSNVPLSDTELVESLWPRVQQWNAIVSKRPYRNEEELRGMFDLFANPDESPLQMKIPKEITPAEMDSKEKGPSQSTRLVDMVLKNPDIVLFKDEYGVAHVQFPVGDHKEVWPCKSGAFTRWLGGEYYRLTKGKTVAGRESVKDAISLLEGRAINECEEHRLFNRVAQTHDAIWYDLGDGQFRAVKITKHGWDVVTDVPILFRRFSHLASQVVPVRGGSVDEVLRFVNVTEEDQRILFLVHLVTSFIPGWPHPALYVYGPQGSAKSTLSRIDRMLIDPSRIEVVSLTRKEEELAQQLAHHSFLSFDNVSEIPDWIADLLCRAITGGGFSKRELYTNDDDVIRYIMANIAINGINLASNRADLLERCILLKLERMKDRKEEHQLMADFEIARQKILGSVFDTVAKAMTLKPGIRVGRLPRMADFALWGCAVAEALGIGQNAFLKAYSRNISSQSEELINDNTVAILIRGIVDAHNGKYEGSPTLWFKAFKDRSLTEQIADSRLPANPSALMRELNRIKTPLEEVGYKVISSSDGNERNVLIYKVVTE